MACNCTLGQSAGQDFQFKKSGLNGTLGDFLDVLALPDTETGVRQLGRVDVGLTKDAVKNLALLFGGSIVFGIAVNKLINLLK